MKRFLVPVPILFLLAACNGGNDAKNTTADTTVAGRSNDTASATAKPSLELVYTDSTYQLTGVAKEEGGSLFVNYPRWSGPYRYAVVTTGADTAKKPFPDAATNAWTPGSPGAGKWVCVQSVYVDDSSRLWVLDPAAPQLGRITGGGAKLVLMNSSGSPARTYSFNGVVSDTSYVNDVRVDVRRNVAYLTDSKTGGIVVLNLASGKAREVLKAHPSTVSDPSFHFVIDGHELMKNGKPAKFNSDGIALTPDGDWLYYKPLSDDKLYRIRTDYLRDSTLSAADLGTKVEDLGHFTTTDGMIFDKAGNLYLGDLQQSRIMRIDKSNKMTEVLRDERLLWPDSYAIADGYLYVSCSQIHKQPDYNNGQNKRTSPYTVYRLRLP